MGKLKTTTAESRKELRGLYAKAKANRNRLLEIRTAAEARENKEYTPEEQEEVRSISNEQAQLATRINILQQPDYEPEAGVIANRGLATAEILYSMRYAGGIPDKYAYLRAQDSPARMIIPANEAAADELLEQRAATTMQQYADVTPIVPITVKDIIEPLNHILIYDKVGLRVQYGIEGQWVFPTVSGATAQWAGENVEISDSKINLDKLVPEPKRLAISVPISNTAIFQTNSGILPIVRQAMTNAVGEAINAVMFSLTQIGGANAANVPAGPFVGKTATNAKGAEFTYKEVIGLKYAVLGTGVKALTTGAFVVSPVTYAELLTTPRDAGSGRMIIDDNGLINGSPVFMTADFDDTAIGFGLFGYELLGFFGNMTLGVDATSAAAMKQDLTYYVLNAHPAMKSLRTEAFAVMKKKTS